MTTVTALAGRRGRRRAPPARARVSPRRPRHAGAGRAAPPRPRARTRPRRPRRARGREARRRRDARDRRPGGTPAAPRKPSRAASSGAKEFWGLPRCGSTARTLVPRPETKPWSRRRWRRSTAAAGAHVRCGWPGSRHRLGRLSALVCELPAAFGVGTDACRHPGARLRARQRRRPRPSPGAPRALACDYGAALAGRSTSSSPIRPYVPHDEIATLAPEVRDFDPKRALDGGLTACRLPDNRRRRPAAAGPDGTRAGSRCRSKRCGDPDRRRRRSCASADRRDAISRVSPGPKWHGRRHETITNPGSKKALGLWGKTTRFCPQESTREWVPTASPGARLRRGRRRKLERRTIGSRMTWQAVRQLGTRCFIGSVQVAIDERRCHALEEESGQRRGKAGRGTGCLLRDRNPDARAKRAAFGFSCSNGRGCGCCRVARVASNLAVGETRGGVDRHNEGICKQASHEKRSKQAHARTQP